MTTAPKTLGQEAVDAVNALIAESDRFRDWTSPEIESLIPMMKRLQKADAREAFVRMGALAAICGDEEQLFEYFRKALQLPDQLHTKHEFWVSMGNAALYKRAHELGSWLLDPKRGFFPRIWGRAASFGHLLEVWDRVPEARRTYPELLDVDFSPLEDAASVMRERKLTDDDIVAVLELMGTVQRAHRIMFAGGFVSIVRAMRPPEDPPYVYFTVPLSTDVAEIHAMNRELSKLIVEKLPDGAFPNGLVSSFAKTHPTELRAAA